MSDAARKNTQAFELGSVAKLFVESLPLRDVLHQNLNTEHDAVLRFDRRVADQPVPFHLGLRRSDAAKAANFAIEDRFTAFERFPLQRLHNVRQLAWKYLPNGAPEVRCDRRSIDEGELRVQPDIPSLGVYEAESDGRCFVEMFELREPVLSFLFRLPAR